MVDVDHSASLRTICAVEQIPLHSSPISAARFHMAGLATAAPLVDASLLRPVVRVDRDAFLAAIPRAPAWIALWELRAATGLTVAAIHRELRRQIGAGRVRASVVATCWQRRRAKAEAVAPTRPPMLDDDLRRLHAQGLSDNAIARQLNRWQRTVSRRLRRLGLAFQGYRHGGRA